MKFKDQIKFLFIRILNQIEGRKVPKSPRKKENIESPLNFQDQLRFEIPSHSPRKPPRIKEIRQSPQVKIFVN